MEFRYSLNDRPSFGAMFLYGLQWLMICIPVVLTSTFVAPEGQMLFFTQKLFAIMGVTMIVNALWGHRMPLIAGPAAVLLMGVLAAATQGSGVQSIYPSMAVGGVLIALLAAFGLMFPNTTVYFYFLIPIKTKWFVIGYMALELFNGVLGTSDGVAHFAHLGGALAGVLLLYIWKKQRNKYRY